MSRWFGCIAAIASVASAACGAPIVPLASYAKLAGPSSWNELAVGTRVVVLASSSDCPEQVLSGPAESAGSPINAGTFGEDAQLTVDDAQVTTGNDVHLAILLRDKLGARQWLSIPAGTSPRCVRPLSPSLERSMTLRSKTVHFDSTRPTCTTIEARGRAVDSLLQAPIPLVVETLVARAEGDDVAVWGKLAGGSLFVRDDVLHTCFVEGPPPPSARPSIAMLRIAPERCEKESGSSHLSCNVPVGVWSGTSTASQVSLRLVHRTQGPVHLVDGKLVDGKRFARTAVAVSTGRADDARSEAVYRGIRRAIADALADERDIRVVDDRDPAVNARIRIEVVGIEISDVREREETGTSRYKLRDEQRPNPELATAKERIRRAKQAARDARATCARDKESKRRGREELLRGCANMVDKKQGEVCKALVPAIDLLPDSCNEIDAADREIDAAEESYGEVPPTVTIPIMGDWTYKKRVFDRTASARVELELTVQDAATTRRPRAFTQRYSDFAVESDPAHNVPAHEARAQWLHDPDAVVPLLTADVSKWAANEMNAALSRASLARARARLGSGARPGFEDVQALANDVAGSRLTRTLELGSSTIAGKNGFDLPSKLRSVSATECVLAVAVRSSDRPGVIAIATNDGSFADERQNSAGHVEICPSDARASEDDTILHVGGDMGDVKWGLFATRGASTASPIEADIPAGSARKVPEAPIRRVLSLYLRPGAILTQGGSVGLQPLSDVFGGGATTALGIGARFGRGWLVYGEWEHAFLGVGGGSPLRRGADATAHGNTVLLGVDKDLFEFRIASYPSAIFLDLGFGYSALAQSAMLQNGEGSFVLSSWAARAGLGGTMRLAPWFVAGPMLSFTLASVSDFQVNVPQPNGQVVEAIGRLESGAIRYSMSLGISGAFDLPVEW